MASDKIKRRWGLLAALPIMVLALLPQVRFIVNRGGEWQGANVSMHADEVAYSCYTASLIRGRPRRVDPYTGRAFPGDAPVPESLFSIQFVPVYVTAMPARWLGMTAAKAFILFPILFGMAAAASIFWFVTLLTRDEKVGVATVWIVLGFGTLMASQGLARYVLNLPYLIPEWISKSVLPPSLFHLPFLRFYQPAIALPLFFVLGALAWLGLTKTNNRSASGAAAAAGATFALLVFSYYFLWTMAAAWLVCLCALWLFARPDERRRTLTVCAIIAGIGLPSLALYFRMLSHRATTVDSAQALVSTHRPDLFRLPEIAAWAVLFLLLVGVRRKIFPRHDRVALFTASLALAILAVFNQQIITGRSLQPFHYEWFIGNYCALTALVLTASVWRRRPQNKVFINKRLAVAAVIALFWGTGEVWLASSLTLDYNRRIDEFQPVANRLKALASTDGAAQSAMTSGAMPIVLTADLLLADRLPTDAPQAVLWAPRMLVFSGVGEAENRERFFQQLYFLGYDEQKLLRQFDSGNWSFYAGMFSYDRLTGVVSGHTDPISSEEMRAQIQKYVSYSRAFDRDRAARIPLSYLIVSINDQPDFVNLDRWYERDLGERIGGFRLYRLKLRH